MSKIDKLRSAYPLEIKFMPGEQPSAAKLTSVSTQAKLGLNIIEKAIGDIWGTGLSEKGLHLTNLGRALGEAKYNNPALFNVGDTRFFYIENLSDNWQGKTTGYLTFRPAESAASAGDALTAIKFSDSTGDIVSATHETVISIEGDVLPNNTNVFVDSITGRFRTGNPIAAGDLVGYWVDPTEWIQGAEDFYPGIIPDPRCDVPLLAIQGTTGGYYFDIPNRAPIEADEADPFQRLSNLPERRPVECLVTDETLGEVDVNDEENIAGAGYFAQTPRFWNSNSSASGFYRYSWLDKPTSGELDPGSIHLWDSDTNSIVEGLDFTVNGTTNYRIDITDTKGRLDWAITQSTPHTFYLITHGSSLSRTVWSLVTALANHDHTGVHYNESNLDHSTLLNLNPASNKDSVVWQKSTFQNDDHIQYLHRGGPNDGSADRDFNKGAMLGDFIMGQATPVGQSYLGINTSSKIWFGNQGAPNPSIYGSANKILNIDASVETEGYTKSTYFSAATGTSNTQGYTFDIGITGGANPDPSLLGFQYTAASNIVPQYELLVNSPNSIVLKLDTNEATSPTSPSNSKFAINNGAGTEVFKVEENGNVTTIGTIAGGDTTITGDLTVTEDLTVTGTATSGGIVTEDISADNVFLSERLDLDHANLLPEVSIAETASAGYSVANNYVYAVQVKLLNGQYSKVVETASTAIGGSKEVLISVEVPTNTAGYKLYRTEYNGTTLVESHGIEEVYSETQLDFFQNGFTPGDRYSFTVMDGDSSLQDWDLTSLGAWTSQSVPTTGDDTTLSVNTNASIETMGDIHTHGSLSNLCPEGKIAVAGIKFKGDSSTHSVADMITGIYRETITSVTGTIQPNQQLYFDNTSTLFDTTSRIVLSFTPTGEMDPGLNLSYWLVDHTLDEIHWTIYNHDTNVRNLPNEWEIVYIQYGDFYA